MMTYTSLILGIALGIGVASAAAWLFIRARLRRAGTPGNTMAMLQNQMNDLARALNEQSRHLEDRLGKSERHMHEAVREQFGESQKLIREITQEITSVKETGRQMVGFGEQLQHLQNVLKNPKQRGVLGEYYLETLLKNVLPPSSYQMQYKLGISEDGKELIPDAVVFVKDKIVPIDSKFSLENYNRFAEAQEAAERDRLSKQFVNDLKFRIQETAKYIQPKQGTTDFAFMFVPHEAIYYDLLTNRVGGTDENLLQRAAGKYRVIIVSPTSFLAYLQTVLQGLKSLQIEEKAQEIIKRVGELGRHIESYEGYMHKLGNSLTTTVNHFNTAHKELKKVDKDVVRIAGKEPGFDSLQIDRPTRDDDEI